MKSLWGGLTRTDYDTLKYFRGKEASLVKKYDRMLETITNRHLNDEQDLQATVGSELEGVRARIAELEAKQQENKQEAAA